MHSSKCRCCLFGFHQGFFGGEGKCLVGFLFPLFSAREICLEQRDLSQLDILIPFQNFLSYTCCQNKLNFPTVEDFLPYYPIPCSELFQTNHPQLLGFLPSIRRAPGGVKSRFPSGDSDSLRTAVVQIHHSNLHGKELTTYANLLYEIEPIFYIHKSIFQVIFAVVLRKNKIRYMLSINCSYMENVGFGNILIWCSWSMMKCCASAE